MIGSASEKRYVIKIPSSFWTAFFQAVFVDILPNLQHRRSAVVYLTLYDRAWYLPEGEVHACLADLAKWTGLDERTVRECLVELVANGHVIRRERGQLRSRSRKPVWRVPLAEHDLNSGGPWTPVPRFLVQSYLPRYTKAVLLLILLRLQHIHGRNECYPGAKYLTEQSGWSKRSVYEALETMNDETDWQSVGSGLPRPLKIYWKKNRQGRLKRYLSVRAVLYN